jgi:hypothetical protein
MIGGFIVTGDVPKKVVLRAIGPSLVEAGVAGVMADPVLDLYDSTGLLIDQDDNWTSLSPEAVAAGLTPKDPAESLIEATLLPGSYTAVLRSANGSPGVALCEIYDLDPDNSDISNISTRGPVGLKDQVLIGGFVIGGLDPTKVIVRAIGPSLTSAGVVGALQNPILELHDSDGSLIFQNDDWRSDQEQQIIGSTVPPSDDRESAIVATLPSGAYTVIVRGAEDTTGVALVEIYDLENQ